VTDVRHEDEISDFDEQKEADAAKRPGWKRDFVVFELPFENGY
jgi:hypothetical protein